MDKEKQSQQRWRWLRLALLIFLLLIGLVFGGLVIWALNPPAPTADAVAALASDAVVTVVAANDYAFIPASPARVGFVLYPGARVDPASYAPLAHAIAAEGFLVIVPTMPLNMAILNPDAALRFVDDYPQIEKWVLGGHSLGGAMAAQFTAANPERVAGLVLWAAYPANNVDLSTFPIPTASIFGTEDGLATITDIEASRPRLPASAEFVAIEGGNHAQFGSYGPQSGDGEATISAAEQQRQIVAATVRLLSQLP